MKVGENLNCEVDEENTEPGLLPLVQKDEIVSLAKLGRNQIKREQDLEPSDKEIRKTVKEKKLHYEITNSIVIRTTMDNLRNERI